MSGHQSAVDRVIVSDGVDDSIFIYDTRYGNGCFFGGVCGVLSHGDLAMGGGAVIADGDGVCVGAGCGDDGMGIIWVYGPCDGDLVFSYGGTDGGVVVVDVCGHVCGVSAVDVVVIESIQ